MATAEPPRLHVLTRDWLALTYDERGNEVLRRDAGPVARACDFARPVDHLGLELEQQAARAHRVEPVRVRFAGGFGDQGGRWMEVELAPDFLAVAAGQHQVEARPGVGVELDLRSRSMDGFGDDEAADLEAVSRFAVRAEVEERVSAGFHSAQAHTSIARLGMRSTGRIQPGNSSCRTCRTPSIRRRSSSTS